MYLGNILELYLGLLNKMNFKYTVFFARAWLSTPVVVKPEKMSSNLQGQQNIPDFVEYFLQMKEQKHFF